MCNWEASLNRQLAAMGIAEGFSLKLWQRHQLSLRAPSRCAIAWASLVGIQCWWWIAAGLLPPLLRWLLGSCSVCSCHPKEQLAMGRKVAAGLLLAGLRSTHLAVRRLLCRWFWGSTAASKSSWWAMPSPRHGKAAALWRLRAAGSGTEVMPLHMVGDAGARCCQRCMRSGASGQHRAGLAAHRCRYRKCPAGRNYPPAPPPGLSTPF